jgi:D-glycero-alpha-D-manno-heptose 1-phosphate guanylyltransferase
MMEAIVLAGGFGTRLRTVVPDVPKPMAPVGKKPFLEILLRGLSRQGVSRVILSLGHKAEIISGHFGAQFAGMELIYTVEAEPLGTGGAIRKALTFCQGDYALVMNGDTYLDIEIDALESAWQQMHQPLIVAQEAQDASRYGRLELENGRVMRFGEKALSGPGLINVGCYIFPKQILDDFPLGQPFSLETDFLSHAVSLMSFGAFITRGRFIDIGVPKDYAHAQKVLADL